MTKRYILRPIGENSYILLDNTERLGLVTETLDGVSVIGKFVPKNFINLEEFISKLGKVTIEEAVITVKEEISNTINGFPIKHKTFANVELEPYPTYTKAQHTKGRYAAGFWALKFQQGWTYAFCPKLTTLAENEHIGPYTTKIELNHQISQKNKEIVL
jgi:hypothetical protein